VNFWRRKKREEFTANNINAGNGKTGIVAVMENAQWASVSDFGGVAVAMGDNGRATARGYLGVALATRTQGEARAEGADGVATTTNAGGRVMGALGCALFAVERADSGKISSVAAAIVDGVNIKPNTWYACRGGELVEVKR
jgi:hypothetical protein